MQLHRLEENIIHWWKFHTIFGSGWNEYHNPYYYWWKARKYFKRPKAHLVKGEFSGYFGLPCRTDSYHKGLNFFCRGLGWKSKYDSPRHEWDPIVCFVWVNPWRTWIPNEFSKSTNSKGEKGFFDNKQYWFGFVFNWITNEGSRTSSMATWEAILDNVVWGHSIKWCYSNHIWKSKDGDITIKNNLKNGILR